MQISPISFGKIYRSKVYVKYAPTGEYELMDFVEYENKKEDKIQLSKYEEESKDEVYYDHSKETNFSRDIVDDYVYYFGNEKKFKIGKNVCFYGIEDRDGNIQCLCEVENGIKYPFLNSCDEIPNKRKPFYITYIGVRPKNFYSQEDREYSRLGVNMVKELAKIAQKNKNGCIWLKSGNDEFWDKIPYIQHLKDLDTFRVINSDNYEACIQELDLMI